MKTKILLTAILLLFLFAMGFAQSNNPQILVLFIDKSKSVIANDEIEKRDTQIVLDILKSRILARGDKVIISYIFSNTAGQSNKYEIKYLPPKEPDYRGLSSLKRKKAVLVYQISLKKYKRYYAQKVLEYCFADNANQTSSNILGSIKVISDVALDNQGSNIWVYYFSDLCESHLRKYYTKGGKRFKDYNEAKEYGATDAKEMLSYYQLESGQFNEVHSISVFLPAVKLDKNRAFEMMPIYFKSLWNTIGIQTIHIQ